jgi:hypothetical protein
VTRGTRPKKPSSSRGLAHEARGARGVWGVRGFRGLKTENCKKKILFPSRQQLPNFYFFIFLFFSRPHGQPRGQPRGGRERGEGEGGGEGREGEGGRGRGGRCIRAGAHVRADASASARTRLVLSQVTSKRTLQCVQVTDAPAAIVRSSVRPFVYPKTSA